MGDVLSSSLSSLGQAAGTGEVVHFVVERLRNGVDRLKLVERVPPTVRVPVRNIDMDDTRVRDLVTLGLARAGIDVPANATLKGFAYDVGEETHKCVWICDGDERTPGAAWRDRLRTPAARRMLYAALLALAFAVPSPWELWRVITAADATTAHAAACIASGPLCTDFVRTH